MKSRYVLYCFRYDTLYIDIKQPHRATHLPAHILLCNVICAHLSTNNMIIIIHDSLFYKNKKVSVPRIFLTYNILRIIFLEVIHCSITYQCDKIYTYQCYHTNHNPKNTILRSRASVVIYRGGGNFYVSV